VIEKEPGQGEEPDEEQKIQSEEVVGTAVP
jgi:hypothetical protein